MFAGTMDSLLTLLSTLAGGPIMRSAPVELVYGARRTTASQPFARQPPPSRRKVASRRREMSKHFLCRGADDFTS